MKNKKIIIIIAIIVIVISSYLIYYTGINNKEDKIVDQNLAGREDDTSDSQFKELTFTIYNKDNNINWHLHSNSLKSFDDQELMKLDSLSIDAFNQKQQKLYSLSTDADTDFQVNKDRLEIKGPVKLSGQKIKLKTGRLQLNHKDDVIGSKGVSIESPQFNINAESFKTDMGLERITLYGSSTKQVHFTQNKEVN